MGRNIESKIRVRVRCLGLGPEHYFMSSSKFHRICSRCVSTIDKRREIDPTVHDGRIETRRGFHQERDT